MSSRRAVLAVLLGACVASCGRGDRPAADAVRAALRRTATLPRGFTYTEASGGHTTRVAGVVEDAFRYRASVTVDGQPVQEAIVRDDALAVRTTGGPWTLDRTGAPDPLAVQRATTGQNPVRDALRAFEYVDAAMSAAARVVVFNPEALDYQAAEDTFPKPDRRRGILRYDLRRPALPSAAQVGGNQAVPAVQHFRKMSVYVRHGVVIGLAEDIDVASRLEELSDIYGTTLPADRAKATAVAVEAINALRSGQGNEPIRVRTMALEITDAGRPAAVTVPADAVPGTAVALGPVSTAPSIPADLAQPVVPSLPGVTALIGRRARAASPPPARPASAPGVVGWMVVVPACAVGAGAALLWRRRPQALR